MEIQEDFRELLALFNEHEVDYAIVGGYALAFHGAPRATGDIDIVVRPARYNAERIIRALGAFGFGSLDLAADDFAHPDRVVQLGYPPVRVDLITSITGVPWDQIEAGLVEGVYGSTPVQFIGRDELLANKRATGRLKDRADLEALGEE
jgi:hypothetical protein